jgi:hypothetical protein
MERIMKALGMISIPAALLMLAGCAQMRGAATNDTAAAAEKESKAEARLCRDMAEKREAIRTYPEVDQETALSTVQEANMKVESAVKDVEGAADNVNNPNIREVQAAYQKLQNTVNSVPGGRSTVGDAAINIGREAQDLQTAWNRLYRELQCGA